MQKGQIFRRHGAWHLRYRIDGKQVSVKLTDYSDEYRTLTSVRPLAEPHLRPVNQGRASGPITLKTFIETEYLPHVEQHRRPSTYRGYRNLFNRYFANQGTARLFSFRTRDGQLLMNSIAKQFDLSHQTLKNIKHFLSGVFVHAKRMGNYDGTNPITDIEIPKGRESQPTKAYSADEVDGMIEALDGPAKVAVVLAAYTGLSLAELRGLKWADINLESDELTVNRNVWHGKIGPPKTQARQSAVPLISIVHDVLVEYKTQAPIPTEWLFEGPKTFPLDLATVGSKTIKPLLAKKKKIEWSGWHAFRRGFATRLYAKGVRDAVVQSLMRHSNFSVTRKNYIKTSPEENVKAIQVLKKG